MGGQACENVRTTNGTPPHRAAASSECMSAEEVGQVVRMWSEVEGQMGEMWVISRLGISVGTGDGELADVD
jgi:hypothetical protein